MKKIILASLVCLLAFIVSSCSSNSPRGITEKAMDCLMDDNYKGFVDCVYLSESDQNNKELLIAYIEESVQKAKEGKGHLRLPKKYKFISEDVDEANGRAEEKFEVEYYNGETGEENIKVKKGDDGKWYILLLS